ncbi:uncharacterized protein VP01_9008g1 [Puccinia sorghi]|uniref:Uncharacterized protein n=1 Tax=Puccinia sorghi TaxID=27349 RepID=A0A0L6U7T6_9BASI|nr:uncharacterized protein VP01_9008g1 [Puccinia sorghi]
MIRRRKIEVEVEGVRDEEWLIWEVIELRRLRSNGSCPAKGKMNGFEMMAINLHNQSPSKINQTPSQMKD